MNTYNVICPICGAVNCSLLLEETDGWMECEACGTTTRSRWKAVSVNSSSDLSGKRASAKL